MSRRTWLIVAYLLAVLTTSCGGEGAPELPASTPGAEGDSVAGTATTGCVPATTVPPTGDEQGLLLGLQLPERAGIVLVRDEQQVFTLVAQSRGSVADLHEAYRRQLAARGYELLREDNEGHEAELYFAAPGTTAAVVQQIEVRCPAGNVQTVISFGRSPDPG